VGNSAQPAFAIPAGAHPAPSIEAVHGPSLSSLVALQNLHAAPSCLHWSPLESDNDAKKNITKMLKNILDFFYCVGEV